MAVDADKKVVSAEEARKLVAGGGAIAIDLRGDEEWEGGHIPGAVRSSESELEEALSDVPDEQPVVVACDDGKLSAKAAESLRGKGRNAVSIDGGMKAWESDKLPEQPRPDEEFEGPDYSKPPGT